MQVKVFYNAKQRLLKELSHGILCYFGHVQNYLQLERNLKIVGC